MSKPLENELWELAASLAEADSEDHEDDEVIQPMFDMLNKLAGDKQALLIDLLTPVGEQQFKTWLKHVCVSDLSYDQLEALGIEDVLVDKSDPAGIVYKIVVAAWEGEGGM